MLRNVELRQQRATIANEMAQLANAGLKTSEEIEKFDRMEAEANRLKAEYERIERADALQKETASRVPQADPSRAALSADEAKDHDEKYKRAYWKYMTRGRGFGLDVLSESERALLVEQRATIGVEGTPTGGAYPGSSAGFVVPVGFISDVEVALKYYGPMLDGGPAMPKILVTETGGPLPFPTSNDTTVSGEIITEASSQNVADVSTGILNFGSYKFSSKIVKVSWEMLQDAGVNIPDFLSQTFATRLGRVLNTNFTVGGGSGSAPNGIITAATAGPTAVGSSQNDGSSGANTIGSADLVSLEHSVDPLYRRQGRFMMHDSVLASIKKTVDKYGHPLWLPGVAAGAPDTILGYRYVINNDMDQLQTNVSSPVVNKNTLLFGDLTKYMIRRVRDITVMRLDELYAGNGQVGFVAFARYDGNLIDAGTHPVKYLVNSY